MDGLDRHGPQQTSRACSILGSLGRHTFHHYCSAQIRAFWQHLVLCVQRLWRLELLNERTR